MKKFLLSFTFTLLLCASLRAQDSQSPISQLKKPILSEGMPSATLPEVVVISQALDVSRGGIVPSLGATQYSITPGQIATQSQGADAAFNQTVLRLPGVAQDSFGQLHVRGEHANLQYRINDVLIPEGISGFGQELSTRFIDRLSLITGALPAQFGYRTAGIVDIHTKSGAGLEGNAISLYGGSYDTINPSFEYGGVDGRLTWYTTGSYLHDSLGIENPTSDRRAIHDDTSQFKGFAYFSYLIDDTSRLNLILSGAHSQFQIPNNPGQPPAFTLAGTPAFDSRYLNENQTEQNYYGILSYQKKWGDLDFQVSAFARQSGVLFKPDNAGDLIFNGVASNVDRNLLSGGIQFDGSYKLGESHTLRGGFTFTAEHAVANSTNLVFPVDAMGDQSSFTPLSIVDDSGKQAYLYGVYLQDEWKISNQFTLNFGGRFDISDAYVDESQFSPRINLVYRPLENTTLHAGYARYFTPPPLELVSRQSISKFAGTTNASEIMQSSPVKSERAHYFDAGVTQKITPNFQLGLDGFYKIARNQLDEGQFGSALIFSPFNYDKGEVYGAELTANYEKDGLSLYGNVSFSHAMGNRITSGEFQFGQDELDYIANHWVHLDHDQRVSISAGAAYAWDRNRIYGDMIFGAGLRSGFANNDSLPSYATANIGVEHAFLVSGIGTVKVRFDIVNLFDKVYEIRDGSGIGVGAPQFGQRRGFYGGVSYAF